MRNPSSVPHRLLAWLCAPAGLVRAYLLLALAACMLLVFLIPPFQVPDEHQHFYRAYAYSEGVMRPAVQGSTAGSQLPASLAGLVLHFLGTSELHAWTGLRPQPLASTLRELQQPLNAEKRAFIAYTGAAPYSPLSYAPQVCGIVAGRALGFGPLGLLYSARLANALTATLLTSVAIGMLPIGRVALLVLATLPMVLYLFASASPDALTISSVVVFSALALRAFMRGRWSGRDVAWACLTATVFCMIRPVYSPLLVLALPIVLRPVHGRRNLGWQALIVMVSMGLSLLWFAYVSPIVMPQKPNTDMASQLARILSDPVQYLAVLVATVQHSFGVYVYGFIGLLGWHTIALPLPLYVLPLWALLMAPLLPSEMREDALGSRAGLWQSLLLGACVLLIFTLIYLNWTEVGGARVVGVQGRYFLPLAAVLAAIFSNVVGRRLAQWPGLVFGALALVVMQVVLTIHAVIRAYQVF